MKERNKIYNLSELDVGDRFVKTNATNKVLEVTQINGKVYVAEAKVIDNKIGRVDKSEFSKPIKECLVKFLRHVS